MSTAEFEFLHEAAPRLIEAARSTIEACTDAEGSGDGIHTMGSAVLDELGRIHVGVNLYHFTGGPCAELSALTAARAGGAASVRLIVAVGHGGRGVKNPCGRCRQIMADCWPGISVVLRDGEKMKIKPIADLLPLGFDHGAEQTH